MPPEHIKKMMEPAIIVSFVLAIIGYVELTNLEKRVRSLEREAVDTEAELFRLQAELDDKAGRT